MLVPEVIEASSSKFRIMDSVLDILVTHLMPNGTGILLVIGYL
ncbi:hypothetical protein ABRZ58_05565 [Vibrio vulnificus]|nr:hypothetical protein [Vibrio vulnificus]WIL74374.1 hypothetical protein QPX65_00660 [Vibrio vulnificus]